LLRDGFQLVIIGRPNAGKSSLLNVLSGQETAIVTELAGTTRDILREQINIDGLAVELVDTAGLRDDPSRIEAEGIRRALDAIRKADAILWIRDATASGEETIRELEPTIDATMPVIIVRNKTDLTGAAAGLSATSPPVVSLSPAAHRDPTTGRLQGPGRGRVYGPQPPPESDKFGKEPFRARPAGTDVRRSGRNIRRRASTRAAGAGRNHRQFQQRRPAGSNILRVLHRQVGAASSRDRSVRHDGRATGDAVNPASLRGGRAGRKRGSPARRPGACW